MDVSLCTNHGKEAGNCISTRIYRRRFTEVIPVLFAIQDFLVIMNLVDVFVFLCAYTDNIDSNEIQEMDER